VREIPSSNDVAPGVPDLWDDGAALFRAVTELEGVVGKYLDAPYVAGRSRHWLKVRARAARLQERR